MAVKPLMGAKIMNVGNIGNREAVHRDKEHMLLLETVWFMAFDEIFFELNSLGQSMIDSNHNRYIVAKIDPTSGLSKLGISEEIMFHPSMTKQHKAWLINQVRGHLGTKEELGIRLFIMNNIAIELIEMGVNPTIVEQYYKDRTNFVSYPDVHMGKYKEVEEVINEGN